MDLKTALDEALPQKYHARLYHLESRSEEAESLFAPPFGSEEVKTTCVKHLLLAANKTTGPTIVSSDDNEALPLADAFCFGLEVFVYDTSETATIFVSKADTTGFLSSSPRATGKASVVQTFCLIFIQQLIARAQAWGLQPVISLFARAQDQYLFPASSCNATKHILDDRQLIKWWCKTLNPLLRSQSHATPSAGIAHILVPGLDDNETRRLLPRASFRPSQGWMVGYPVSRLSRDLTQATRCLIPRFPDDPKGRFMDYLDDQLVGKDTDRWPTVRSVDEFWEQMQFRQECCAGRLVGFIWILLESGAAEAGLKADLVQGTSVEVQSVATMPPPGLLTPESSQSLTEYEADPKILQEIGKAEMGVPSTPPSQVPAPLKITESQYDELFDLLTDLDFEGPANAVESTSTWIQRASKSLGRSDPADWRISVAGSATEGSRDETQPGLPPSTSVPTVLVGRKRKVFDSDETLEPMSSAVAIAEPVILLGSNVLRKKPKLVSPG